MDPGTCRYLGNETADDLAKTSLQLQISKSVNTEPGDLQKIIKKDHKDWSSLCWPYGNTAKSTNLYYQKVIVKTKRPWFEEINASRR